MKEKEIQPSWAQIFVCFCVSILAFWFVFNITDLLMNLFTPPTGWLINIFVLLYLAVVGAEALGAVKLYEFLIKKTIEIEKECRKEEQQH